MHYYQFNIGEYASHTRHLTPIEDIAYRRLLDLAYTSEQPLNKDIKTLSRLINLREYSQEICDILNEFFYEVSDGWVNNRVIKEINKTGRKSELAKNSAARRWDNARNKENDANAYKNDAESMRTHDENAKNDATNNPLPITNNPLPITKGNFILNPIVNQAVWAVWDNYRCTGKKWTKHAKTLSMNRLVGFIEKGYNQQEIVETSIERGYSGLFKPKENNGYRQAQTDKSPADRVMRLYGESQQNEFLELSHE